jgi:hypothetical protein
MGAFTSNEILPDAKEKFARGAGWRYGLILGVSLVLAGWGWDAWELSSASVELPWVKLLVASVTLIPLAVAAGWIAGRAYPSFLVGLLVWIVWGTVGGFIAGHLPFEVLSAFASWIDPAARGVNIFPFTSEAQFFTAATMFMGVLAAFPIEFLQSLSTDWSWDRTTLDNRLTLGACAMLFIALPLGLGLGTLDNAAANSLSAPMLLTNQVIQVALTTAPNLDTSKMPTDEMLVYIAGLQWRDKISRRFTEHLADYDPNTFQQSAVDLVFDNGTMLRCNVVQYARYIAGCYDLAAAYRAVLPMFIRSATAPCSDCTIEIQPQALAWQSQHGRDFDDISGVTVVHHLGGVVTARGEDAAGKSVECRFVGANPVRLEECQ